MYNKLLIPNRSSRYKEIQRFSSHWAYKFSRKVNGTKYCFPKLTSCKGQEWSFLFQQPSTLCISTVRESIIFSIFSWVSLLKKNHTILSFNNTVSINSQNSQSLELLYTRRATHTVQDELGFLCKNPQRAIERLWRHSSWHFVCKDASSLRFFTCNQNTAPPPKKKSFNLSFFKTGTRHKRTISCICFFIMPNFGEK